MGPRRQNVTAGNDDHLAGTGNPGIDPRIDADQLLRPKAIRAREVVEGVLIDGHHGLVLAEYHVVGTREGIYGRAGGGGKREPHRSAHRDPLQQADLYLIFHGVSLA